MKILSVRHSTPHSDYTAETRFRERGHELSRCLFSNGDTAPSLDSFDALVVFGGYMAAYDDDKIGWLPGELSFVEKACAAGKPVLGICLGAQILARVLGGRAYRHTIPEIGFHPITLTAAGKSSPFFRGFESGFTGFEWHFDSFDLPPGAVRLAERPTCVNQAFSWGDKVVATQFHVEYTKPQVTVMVEESKVGFPAPTATVQSGDEILGNDAGFGAIARASKALVDNFLAFACKA